MTRIALIGYGKMGHAVEDYARQAGCETVLALDRDDPWPERMEADVAIEFSTPQTAAANVLRCIGRGLPVVCGTTGWYDRYDEVRAECLRQGGRLLTATNFSIGMNIMFMVNEYLAGLMAGTAYGVDIAETHHVHKLDAPSGTAISLRDQIVAHGRRTAEEVPITSRREGEVAGTHTVSYDSAADRLVLTHEAHNRTGLAQGAVMAAAWLAQAAPGVYTMRDVLARGDA